MAQLIPSLATLVAAFSDCFHPQVLQTFQALIAGWIVCQGPRTISEVWLATGLAAKRHHDTAYAQYRSTPIFAAGIRINLSDSRRADFPEDLASRPPARLMFPEPESRSTPHGSHRG